MAFAPFKIRFTAEPQRLSFFVLSAERPESTQAQPLDLLGYFHHRPFSLAVLSPRYALGAAGSTAREKNVFLCGLCAFTMRI